MKDFYYQNYFFNNFIIMDFNSPFNFSLIDLILK
jgi:hypothetical protein